LTFSLRDEKGQFLAIAQVSQSLEAIEHTRVVIITAIVLCCLMATVLVYAVGYWLSSRELQPLSLLSSTMQSLSEQKLQVRLPVPKPHSEEVQKLTDAFNQMLTQIQMRDAELERHGEHLEEQVAARTAELQSMNKINSVIAGILLPTLGLAAAAEPEDNNLIGEIIVTAQKRATALQDVPFSVAAMGESQIRDTNVAQQAANLSKAQTLSQASIAAMAQANSAPQAVLALLRG